MKFYLFLAISAIFIACAPTQKSPIDITAPQKCNNYYTYVVDYFDIANFKIENKSQFIYIPLENFDNFVTLKDTIDGHSKEYKLSKMLIFSPSLHTKEGNKSDAEIVFVHKDTSNNYLIISQLVEQGEENQVFSIILKNLPNANASVEISDHLDLFYLLPQSTNFYIYDGSTLEKPYTHAKYIVLKQKTSLSPNQIDLIKKSIVNSNIKICKQTPNTILCEN